MLHQATKSHILSLSDGELLRYVLMGRRMYEAEAVAFAQGELERRAIPAERVAELRPGILAELAAMDATAEPDPTRDAPAAIVCQRCGVEAPTAYREYLENFGLLVVRLRTRYSGTFCRRCSTRIFLRASVNTLFLGWWGYISFLLTPFYLLHNLLQFFASLRLKAVASDTPPPSLDENALERIAPHLDELTARMLAGDEAAAIARDVAAKSGLTPGQIWRYLQTTAKNQFAPEAKIEETKIRP